MDMSLLQTKMKPATPLPELQTVEDIYRWIDENIAYGWQDKDGGTHTSEMKDFRRLYRTMSVTETLRQKIGTCIEQVALMHELLDAIGIPNQMYCCRIFEPDDYGNLEEEEHMHCFLLYFQNGKRQRSAPFCSFVQRHIYIFLPDGSQSTGSHPVHNLPPKKQNVSHTPHSVPS